MAVVTCTLGYKDRPCTFQGIRSHYFVTVYRSTSKKWAVRTEYHGPRAGRSRRRSNSSAKYFATLDEARAWATAKHAEWTSFPEGLPVVLDLGEGIS